MRSTTYLNSMLEKASTQNHREPDWLDSELSAWNPPEKLTVSEWADNYRILDSKTSAFPGKWKTNRTPYLKDIMNQFNTKGVEEIVFCKPTQIGGTEALNNIFGYIVDQDPNPVLTVYPTKDLAESISENRIQPMLELSPALADKFRKNDSKKLELQFEGMYMALSGANSPSSLASRPVRYVLFDEVDKFPKWSGEEASPISLAKERTKTFYNKKIFMASTPTIESGHIWKNLMASDVILQYYVPCPHCGALQTFKFGQIKWPEDVNDLETIEEKSNKVSRSAWYECESCGDRIDDKHKLFMLQKGEWGAVRYTDEGKWEPTKRPSHVKKIGFHLNSIYSPWVSFGEVAAKFLESKDFPEELQNFVNSWLGEPWRDESHFTKSDVVLDKQAEHERGTVPEGAMMLTAGVDVQKGHFWWTVRAWGEKLTSWLVDYGRAETWDELEDVIMTRKYPVFETGELMRIRKAFFDTGYRTDEVYEFCSLFSEVCKPCKGSSRKLTAPFTVSKIDKKFGNLYLWNVDTHYFKDFIFSRLKREAGDDGSFMVFDNCPRQYADQLTAEQKVMVQKKNGTVVEEYQTLSSHAANHLLDCEVYAACAAEDSGVRYLHKRNKSKRKSRKRRVLSKGVSV